MSPWAYQTIKKMQQEELKELESRVKKIIDSAETTTKEISDFSEIDSYLQENFSKVDLSDISIYLSAARVMNRNGFEDAAGCYIDCFKSIFVKKRIKMCSAGKGRFYTEIYRLMDCTIDTEDVVMHELMHAISVKVRSGGGARFVNNEEEFVYTNCVDFYRRKGKSDEEIVKTSFLPFCLHDVMSDKKIIRALCKEAGSTIPNPKVYSRSVYKRKIDSIFNSHAKFLASRIVEKAKARSYKMIELHDRYGRHQLHTNVVPDFDPALRMDTIDMDCEL